MKVGGKRLGDGVESLISDPRRLSTRPGSMGDRRVGEGIELPVPNSRAIPPHFRTSDFDWLMMGYRMVRVLWIGGPTSVDLKSGELLASDRLKSVLPSEDRPATCQLRRDSMASSRTSRDGTTPQSIMSLSILAQDGLQGGTSRSPISELSGRLCEPNRPGLTHAEPFSLAGMAPFVVSGPGFESSGS